MAVSASSPLAERYAKALCHLNHARRTQRLINLDGRVVDEGAAFELGFAHALGKQCVGYRTDVRVLLPCGLNPMVTVPLSDTFKCIEALEAWAKELYVASDLQRPRLVK